MLADLCADIVQMQVNAVRFEALAFGPAAFDHQDSYRYGNFRAELGDASDDGDASLTGTTFWLLFLSFLR